MTRTFASRNATTSDDQTIPLPLSLPLPRVDSPLGGTPPMSFGTQSDNRSTNAASSSPDPGFDTPNSKPIPPGNQRSASTSKGNSSLHFFVVDHPEKLKDKRQMRELRKHVMYDYLDKERRNPESTDARVMRSTTVSKNKKRKRLDAQLPASSCNPQAPSCIFGPRQSSVSAVRGTASSTGSSDGPSQPAPTSDQASPPTKRQQPADRRPISFCNDIAPLVPPIAADLSTTPYSRVSLEDIPNPTSYIGSDLNPFETWPAFSDLKCSIGALKWCCSRYFSSQGLSAHWVPTVLQARHAFLSTICISSSHEDIMRRAEQAPHERRQHGSHARMQARGEVISLINHAMNDDKARTADTTIIAVLQLLASEIMGCDDQAMRIHQEGLHRMVRHRGGLDNLGVAGQLAPIMTIKMYMISALRETEPHADFVKYAAKMRTRSPHSSNLQPIPESPVYFRRSGYHTILQAAAPPSPVYRLLEILRLLFDSFVRTTSIKIASPTSPIRARASSAAKTSHDVHMLRDEIFALRPAAERPDDFPGANDQHTYEALRLVAMVYSHALAHEIPFSKSASELSRSFATQKSWHTLIQSHIQRTNLSDCWSHMAGVLFWATLVAAACANPDSASVALATRDRDRWDEHEEARKWLTAVAMRCSILLSFEYGGAILETLKRLVGMEQALGEIDREKRPGGEEGFARRARGGEDENVVARDVVQFGVMRQRQQQPASSSAAAPRRKTTTTTTTTTMFGPAERPFVQRTFQDFAQDFLSDTI
ncbi:Hypothetical predicted protein [Lecanosticta acicola]|uniref:Uncharacterized protein n=1 Tax=Lecanosticta acicola TaxID=111012 RepID=A0AAI8Z341_9PEZI|nr:Hypothetical predicted protein [Lecanosticta acicola]